MLLLNKFYENIEYILQNLLPHLELYGTYYLTCFKPLLYCQEEIYMGLQVS